MQEQLRLAKEESINTTFRTVTDYAQDDKFKPCCNRGDPTQGPCRCDSEPDASEVVESWA